jgi:hypothetical protein
MPFNKVGMFNGHVETISPDAPDQERTEELEFRGNQPVPKQTGHRASSCIPVAPHASHAIQAFGSECHVMRPPQTLPSASISRQRLVFVGSA